MDLSGQLVKLGLPGQKLARVLTITHSGADATPRARSEQRQTRLTPEQRKELTAKYLAGSRIPDLCRLYEVHRTTVLGILQQAEASRPPTARKLTDEDVERAAVLYGDGASLAAVAKQFGVNASTMRHELLKAGIPIRSRRGWDQRC